MTKAAWYYKHIRIYRFMVRQVKRITLPFMGGLPLYWVIVFFIRNMRKESVNLRASSIAYNLFLSLFPSLIFLFTLLPYVPVKNLNEEILLFLQKLMPSTAFQSIDEVVKDVMENPRSGLLSIGLLAALYFASNGVYSLMETFNRRDKRSFFKKRLVAIGLTLTLGILLITMLSLFLLTQFSMEMLIYSTPINDEALYYIVIILQWLILFMLLFGGATILYRHGDSRSERWRYIYPGAALASLLMVATSIGYAYYVDSWGNYNRLYGSLGAIIITMLWLYFNSAVIIIGHEFNRSLIHARLAIMRYETLMQNKELK